MELGVVLYAFSTLAYNMDSPLCFHKLVIMLMLISGEQSGCKDVNDVTCQLRQADIGMSFLHPG